MTLQVIRPGDKPYRLQTIYGPTGAGKSWYAASAESSLGGRTLILMTEGAESGLIGFDVDVLPVHSMEELKNSLKELKSDPGVYKGGVLVLDSLSQMERFADAVDAEVEHKRGNTKTPLNIPLDSYKRVQEDIRRTVWYARTLPMHVILICLDRIFTDKNDVSIRLIGPNVTPGLSGDIRAYSDVVGYLTAEVMNTKTKGGKEERKLVRRLFLQPGEGYHARVRGGKDVVVPEYIVNPTIKKVLEILEPKEAKAA